MKRELSAKERELEYLPKGSLYLKPRKNYTSLCWQQEASQSVSKTRSQKSILIEYFGMVDDDYGLRMLEKIRLYLNHGYISERNILFLFETQSSGIDLMAIHSSIKQ